MKIRNFAQLVLVSALGLSGAAQAEVTVSSSCRALIGFIDPVDGWITTQDDCSSSFDSSPLTGMVGGSAQLILPSPTDIVSDVAYADYSARGDYGNLGVAASSWAAHPNTSPYATSNMGQASVTVTANDTILVTSSTLEQGTWVTISLDGYIEGTVSGSILKSEFSNTSTSATIAGYVEIRSTSNNGTLFEGIFLFDPCFSNIEGQCNATNGGFSQSYSDTLVARVGSTLTFNSHLYA